MVVDNESIRKLDLEIDEFLSSFTYKNLTKERDIYNLVYHKISKLVLRNFEEIDPTKGIEIDIRRDYTESKIEITGYIKIINRFINIDVLYTGEPND